MAHGLIQFALSQRSQIPVLWIFSSLQHWLILPPVFAVPLRTLAAIADPRALDILISTTLTDFAPSVRRAAAKGLGNLHWQKLDISASQIAINRALETLLFICEDTDWSIRYAAIVGLQALAKVALVQSPILAKFQLMLTNDPEKAVRARVQLACSQ